MCFSLSPSLPLSLKRKTMEKYPQVRTNKNNNKRPHHPWATKLGSFGLPPSLMLTLTLPIHPSTHICSVPDSPSHGHHPDVAHLPLLSPCCLAQPFQSILPATAE